MPPNSLKHASVPTLLKVDSNTAVTLIEWSEVIDSYYLN